MSRRRRWTSRSRRRCSTWSVGAVPPATVAVPGPPQRSALDGQLVRGAGAVVPGAAHGIEFNHVGVMPEAVMGGQREVSAAAGDDLGVAQLKQGSLVQPATPR